ncbi:MAG TPA: hypothetical protein QF650_02945 [Vicinamibacterales bacterium]|jgi:DNA-directed RNA polymerase specialized sigma24 family protein|nr:hypothetical protein [Acidobacteriota bacterium]MDP7480065.1 hypothetical protein [Vicinamibacterales bacterium]HJO37539.1 hypothetical protein [Vicinamibacterales bacterium]|tara:strand:- start:1206 stop:1586 length:381 start_codon:yes stop_codon:yes gene_type:complete
MHNDESAPAAPPRATDLAEIRQKLSASVARVCPRWSADQREEREEIVQGALVRLAERLEQDEETEGFGASYPWRVAFTATIDEVRRRQRRREVPLDETSAVTLVSSKPRSKEANGRPVRAARCKVG